MSDSGQSPAPGARRRWTREKEPDGPGERREGEEPAGLLQKTPIILAKPPGERAPQPQPKAGTAPAPPPPAPPIVLMKSRGEGEGRGPAGGGASSAGGEGPAVAPPREREGPRPTQPVYQLHGRGLGAAPALDPAAAQSRLAAPEKMKTSIKLVDEQMNWCDCALQFLLEQTDVLVVGALGLQGTGKSTVLSLLAGNQPDDDPRTYVFRPAPPELRQRGAAQTGGIDLFVTQERVVLLDTQPILSPALLDHLINNDRKLPPEYGLPHSYVEMQSLQIAAFLFTVCHVVLLVQDWFTDPLIYSVRADPRAPRELLPPAPAGDAAGAGDRDGAFAPALPGVSVHVGPAPRVRGEPVPAAAIGGGERGPAPPRRRPGGTQASGRDPGVQEGPRRPGRDPGVLEGIQASGRDPGVREGTQASGWDPGVRAAPQTLFPALPAFRGSSCWRALGRLRGRVLGAGRAPLGPSLLTERSWFHYAARIWDGVKKSSALAEYGRLLG